MSKKPHTFTEQGAKRIVDAVRKVEQTPRRRIARQSQAPTQPTGEFWARITSLSINGTSYSWVAVYWDNEVNDWVRNPDAYGDDNAIETNGRIGVPSGSIIKLRHVGYDVEGEPRYVFEWGSASAHQGGLPPHDHRDNFNGGFAFAVYHPGTSLPQMPWAI